MGSKEKFIYCLSTSLFMAEVVIKVDVPEELKSKFEVALAKLAKEFVRKVQLEELQEKLGSDEEKELIEWSIELGRKAKKGSFKKLLAELSEEERKELLV